jgi:hypothetical protein
MTNFGGVWDLNFMMEESKSSAIIDLLLEDILWDQRNRYQAAVPSIM